MATIASSELKTGSDIRGTTIRLLTQLWPWIFLLALVTYFSFMGTGFFSVRSFGSILTNTTLIMLMALGQTYVIITAGIDLSIGWTVGLASVCAAILMRDLSGSIGVYQAIVVAILGGLSVSLIPGLVNGLLITKARIQIGRAHV